MASSPNPPVATAGIDGLLAEMRPVLHRYCARMVGSVIDGEDVLQDALIKAVESAASAGPIGNPEGWLFRIAHNTALDFLRRRSRQEARRSAARYPRWLKLRTPVSFCLAHIESLVYGSFSMR